MPTYSNTNEKMKPCPVRPLMAARYASPPSATVFESPGSTLALHFISGAILKYGK